MVHDTADKLAQADLLTRRQADVFYITQIAGRHRHVAAKRLGISESAVDDHLRRARSKLNAARRTLELLDEIEADDGDRQENEHTDNGERDDSGDEPQGSNSGESDVGHDSWGLEY